MKSELIYDDGKIRRCQSNMAKLGVFGTWWNFEGYGEVLKRVEIDEIFSAVRVLVLSVLLVVLFPILPYLRAYFTHKAAVKAVDEHLHGIVTGELAHYYASIENYNEVSNASD